MNSLLLLITLLLQYTSCLQESNKDGQPTVYCVTSTSNHSNSSCHSLRYYMRNSSLFFKSSTTFIFHPGVHLTDLNTSLQVSNISEITLKGHHAVILCKQQNNFFHFQHIQKLVITNLNFSQCGCSSTTHAIGYATLWFAHVIGLKLANITVWFSEYQGILMDNITGKISIIDSVISGCETNKYYKLDKRPANAMYFGYCLQNASLAVKNVALWKNINSVVRGANTAMDYPFAAGLTVVIRCPNIAVYFDNVTAIGNSGGDGGNLAFIFHTPGLDQVPPVVVNNSHIKNGVAVEGGGIFASLVEPVLPSNMPEQNGTENHSILHVENTEFINNSAYFLGGAIGIRQKESSTVSHIGDIVIKNCTFIDNSLKKGGNGGIAITSINFILTEVERHISPQFKTFVTNCFFYHNYVHKNKRMSAGTAVIFVKTNPYFSFQDIIIDSNNSSAILGLQSNLVLGGRIDISSNTAESGGGILLCQNAVLYFETGLDLVIYNNSAKHTGGGIAVESICMVSKPICFFQLATSSSEDYSNISVTILNNTAKHAGDNLYGGSVDYCYMIENSAHDAPANKSLAVFYEIFNIHPNGSGLPYITSPPDHVCICINNSANCDISDYNYPISVYPGQMFNIEIILVGQLNGSVPGLVDAVLKHESHTTQLQEHLRVRALKPHCTEVPYGINSSQTEINVTMAIYAAQQGDVSVTEYLPQYRPLYVTITLSNCPKGFVISNETMTCTCEQIFYNASAKCFIENQTILVEENTWIGYINDSDSFFTQGTYVITNHCPPEYCNSSNSYINTAITEFEQDSQCLVNRQGIMCGQCKPGYSVVFGGTGCAKCSNVWLSLIIVDGIAGILIVFVLTFFDVTVADGTINGFIFYANTIQAHYHYLFKVEKRNRWLTKMLTAFVGWISFENGIERCFYDGMTEYQKAWIQFVFSFYIWFILGLIVLLSRRYTIAMKIVGKNAVKVLATLILLSYSKLLLSVIGGLDATNAYASNGDCRVAWTKDGNIPFLGEKHLPLFIFSVCLLIILIPFTVSLLFIQVLERFSHYRIFYLVRKLKPLLDAYTGPYADNARFWTGFLLLIRIIIIATSTFVGRFNSIANISVTIALLFVILSTAFFLRNGVYKKSIIQALEGSLLLNLALLFISNGFAQFHKRDLTPLSQFFVGIAFLTFIIVISYHMLKKIYTVALIRRCLLKAKSKVTSRVPHCRIEPHDNSTESTYLPRVIQFTDDREPLLASRNV